MSLKGKSRKSMSFYECYSKNIKKIFSHVLIFLLTALLDHA